jgi:hypothetical protein
MIWSSKSSLKKFGLVAVLVFTVKGILVLIGTLTLAGVISKKPSQAPIRKPAMVNGMFIDYSE